MLAVAVAAGLAVRLRTLHAMRQAAAWLAARPVLGQDVFARGAPESLVETDSSRLALDIPGLIRAYLAALRRSGARRHYRPATVNLWSIQQALARLGELLGKMPDWSGLEQFLPRTLMTPQHRRPALASTLVAGLEVAGDGRLGVRQEELFGPILVHSTPGGAPQSDPESEAVPPTEDSP